MLANKDSLAKAVNGLKCALAGDAAGREKNWTARVDQALAAFEQAVWQHRADLSDAEGRVVDVETSLNPSPTVARRADELRQALAALLEEATALRARLKDIQPSQEAPEPTTAAGALPVAPEAADLSDFGVFCARAEQLLQRFEHYDQEEAELIQESITMDLGAGD
jgi:predicted  nucleic acid-binding Zn-ribbon protein